MNCILLPYQNILTQNKIRQYPTCEKDRMVDHQQFLQQIAKPDSISGRHQHLKEGDFFIIFECGNYSLPGIHTLHVKVHVTTPQVTYMGKLQVKELVRK